MGPPLAAQQFGIGQQGGKIQPLEGRGHHQQLEIGPQRAARFDAQRQRQIGMQAALVKLIEDQQLDPGKLGIALQHAGQDPFGDYLQPGIRADPALTADPIANLLPHRLAQLFGQKAGDVARRQATRLQHDDATRQAARLQQRQRQGGRFTGTGRRLHDHRPLQFQRRHQLGQQRQGRQRRRLGG